MVRGAFEQDNTSRRFRKVAAGAPPGLHAFLEKLKRSIKMMRVKRLFKGSRRPVKRT
jgi:hypothetical protein